MAYKQCVFDGCRSRGDTPGRTLFIFPLRDPDRLQQWLEVTGCTVQDLDQMARHVCDLHFHSKYFSNNPRRKVLVGQAVPFRPSGASSSAVPDVDTADGAHLMDEPDGEEEASEEELLGVVEELELNEDEELGEYVVDSNDHIDELVDEEMGVTEEEQSVSRKDNPTDNGSGDQNASKSSARKDSKPVASQAPSLKRPRQEVQEEHPVASKAAKISPSATLISIKGVQYVQIPKQVYLAEQQIARDEIEYWKNLVKGIKRQLDDVYF